MSDPLQSIDHLASLAGLEPTRQDETFVFGFNLADDRSQKVYIKVLDESERGIHRIAFLSPCQRLGSGFLSGLSKTKAIEILRHNASLPAGHFCLVKMGQDELLCVRSVKVLENLSVQEFKTHCLEVSTLADDWEQQIGRDDF